jgi:hypothetical protein
VGGEGVAFEWEVIAAVLVFERVQVPAADLHRDGGVGGDFGESLQLVFAQGHVFGVVAEEVKEVFISCADEIVDVVAVFHAVSRVREFGLEGRAEGPLDGCGRDNNVLCAVRTGYNLALRWWRAIRRWRRSEVRGIASVRPASVVDEEAATFFLCESIAHPEKKKSLAEANIFSRHRESHAGVTSLVARRRRSWQNSSFLRLGDVQVRGILMIVSTLLSPVFHSSQTGALRESTAQGFGLCANVLILARAQRKSRIRWDRNCPALGASPVRHK